MSEKKLLGDLKSFFAFLKVLLAAVGMSDWVLIAAFLDRVEFSLSVAVLIFILTISVSLLLIFSISSDAGFINLAGHRGPNIDVNVK